MERQRACVQGLWREGGLDDSSNFGLPLNVLRKRLISINNSRYIGVAFRHFTVNLSDMLRV